MYNAKATTTPECYTEIGGVEFQSNSFDQSLEAADVPCAVCITTKRIVKLMIPAQTQCPNSGWTREYGGFLMTSLEDENNNAVFECVDESSQAIPNSSTCQDNAGFYSVVFKVGGDSGLPAASYKPQPVTCVVCTI